MTVFKSLGIYTFLSFYGIWKEFIEKYYSYNKPYDSRLYPMQFGKIPIWQLYV